MYNERDSYRARQSVFSQFVNSCLGRIIIFVGILAILAIIAIITCPSEQKMQEEMTDNIRQCIEANDSIHTDWIDDAINNVGYIFTDADSTAIGDETMKVFFDHNPLMYSNHTLFSTMRLYNSFQVQGIRCGIGIFGLVIPTVNFNDFILRSGPLRREYNQPVIHNDLGDDTYMGENPDLGGAFHYEGE